MLTRRRRHRRRTYIMRRMIAAVVLLGIIALIPTLVGFKQDKEAMTPAEASTPKVEPMKQGPVFPEIDMGSWRPSEATLLSNEEIPVGALTFVNATNQEILIDKNANDRVFPASTTKLMTALLAYEKACAANELDQPIISIQQSTLDIPWDSHIAHLAI
ncbi:MAG: D-alanyl-D-alanine carboxypeptidase, partial [Exiguobacterium sp.]|nr:D-alanyl-D-alanine carboxypeptidase [Exiguobacterium sp.]